MNKTVFLIGNPIAGGNALRKIQKAASIIKSNGYNVNLMLTEKRGDAENFAKYIAEKFSKTDSELLPLVVAAGGDGTYNEVVNGIAETNIPLAILSLGTTNVLAKELNLPENLEDSIEKALKKNMHPVSLGKITYQIYKNQQNSDDTNSTTRYFLLMAGIGFDASVVFDVNKNLKKYLGKTAYITNGIKTFLQWKPSKLTFTIDGSLFDGYSAIICNSSKYAGNFAIAPDAKITEDCLYAFIMCSPKRTSIIKYFLGILAKKHLQYKDIIYMPAKKISITGNSHIQIDGDYIGNTPAKIEIVKNALQLIF